MPKMTNQKLIREYINYNQSPNLESTTGNLYIVHDGRRLMNYGTCLAERVGSFIIINTSKYSSTTSKIQGMLNRELSGITSVVYTTEHVPMGTRENLSQYAPKPAFL